jgi:hypothetical protein
MTGKRLNIIVLFFIGGLASGLLTLMLIQIAPWVMWFGVGFVFLLGLAVSFVLALNQGWLLVTASWTRYFIASLIVGASYIVALWLVLFPVWLLYKEFLFTGSPEELSEGGGTAPGFALGLFAAGLISAALIALALRVATRRWDNKAVVLMLLAGVISIPLTSALVWVLEIRDSIPVLLAVGQPLIATVCGYWLLKTASLLAPRVDIPLDNG